MRLKNIASNYYYSMIAIASIILMFAINASADLGSYDFNKCVEIKTISNSTNVNISSISYPNSTKIPLNAVMTKNGKTFNYTFCKTNVEGTYIYDYFDDKGNTYVNSFRITKEKGTGVFNIDFSQPIYIAIAVILIIGIAILCIYGLFVYASALTIILGFVFLYSGINVLLSGIAIMIGVILAFVKK